MFKGTKCFMNRLNTGEPTKYANAAFDEKNNYADYKSHDSGQVGQEYTTGSSERRTGQVYNDNISLGTASTGEPSIETVYKRMHYGNTMPDGRMLVFMTGFCLGMVFFYFSKGSGIDSNPLTPLLAPSQISQLKNFETFKGGLLEYVTITRLGQLIFLFLCATSAIGGILAYSILGGLGFEFGLLMFSSVYQNGILGILLAIMMFFPHGIFYIIVFLKIFYKFWGIDKKYYHNNNAINSSSWHNKVTELRKILVILTVFCFGILSETYINPEILRKLALLF